MTTHSRASHGPCVCGRFVVVQSTNGPMMTEAMVEISGAPFESCAFCRFYDECAICGVLRVIGPGEGPESAEEMAGIPGTLGAPVVIGSESALRPSLPDVPLDEARGYHWRDGLFFRRLPDGAVSITRQVHLSGAQIIANIPAAEWCSIIAAVSHDQGESTDYSIANYLHMGPPA